MATKPKPRPLAPAKRPKQTTMRRFVELTEPRSGKKYVVETKNGQMPKALMDAAKAGKRRGLPKDFFQWNEKRIKATGIATRVQNKKGKK